MRQFSTELSHKVSCANAGAVAPIAHTTARIIDRRIALLLHPVSRHPGVVILRESVGVWLGGGDSWRPERTPQIATSINWRSVCKNCDLFLATRLIRFRRLPSSRR